jgi:membrane fusion protein, multidrug efflux system
MTGRSSRLIVVLVAGLAVAAIVAGLAMTHQAKSRTARGKQPASVPVTLTSATQRDVPIYFDALGTVQALNTVAIHAQVNGQVISVNFRQGQEVHKGDVLARIDPAPYKAALDQAVAKKNQDQAQLSDAQKDLVRFKTLALKHAETEQNVDTQQAKVDQFTAAVAADQAAIEAAQTQLDYATITAPIDGVVGFRQVDIGNVIHTTDANPLTVLTQVKPCTVIFTLPQDDLGPVREAMLKGSVDVLALDQDNVKQLAQGRLLLIDNQIDQTTSTIRLKAEFPNQDERLWPGEFVHIRILVATRKDAVTIPPAALQRGPEGVYVWVVKPDNTAELRPVDAQLVGKSTALVSKGLKAGERVVLDGQMRLDQGSPVSIRPSGGPARGAGTTG